MSHRRTAGIAAGIAMGFALGATLTLAIQGWANLPDPGSSAEPPAVPTTEPQPPEAFLVWTSGGMPAGFRAAVGRLDGIRFASLAFTNLTQDHLDLHGTMEAYFEAKRRLFLEGRPPAARASSSARVRNA